MDKEIERINKIFDAVEAQKNYLKGLAKEGKGDWMQDSFEKGEGFAPVDGVCYFCHKNIYADYHLTVRDGKAGKIKEIISKGISLEKASSELTTGCPHCHHSFVD